MRRCRLKGKLPWRTGKLMTKKPYVEGRIGFCGQCSWLSVRWLQEDWTTRAFTMTRETFEPVMANVRPSAWGWQTSGHDRREKNGKMSTVVTQLLADLYCNRRALRGIGWFTRPAGNKNVLWPRRLRRNRTFKTVKPMHCSFVTMYIF